MIEYLWLLRPRQWTKNIFVLLPIIFSGIPLTERGTLLCAGFAFLAFCCWSSGVYVLNDLVDCSRDRTHPRKKNRPIAAGTVSVQQAKRLIPILLLAPYVVAGVVASCYPQVIRSKEGFCLFLLTGGLYLLNNFLYCFSLRKIVILDVISIAFGFLLRALAGCFILDILPSKWLIICTFTLALFLGFGKRRMELARHEETAAFRSVLSDYSQRLLDILLAISAAVTLICYLLYTLSPETIALHQTHSLLLTIPFVILGVIRYIQLSVSGIMDGPDEVLWRDIPFLVNALLWGLTVLFVLTNR